MSLGFSPALCDRFTELYEHGDFSFATDAMIQALPPGCEFQSMTATDNGWKLVWYEGHDLYTLRINEAKTTTLQVRYV